MFDKVDIAMANELIKTTVEQIEKDFASLLTPQDKGIVIRFFEAGFSADCIHYACHLSWQNCNGDLNMRYAERLLSHWLSKGISTREEAEDYVESEKKKRGNGSKKRIAIRNWDNTDNRVMKGYILYALAEMVKENREYRLTHDQTEAFVRGLEQATDDMTAEDAYRYFMAQCEAIAEERACQTKQ